MELSAHALQLHATVRGENLRTKEQKATYQKKWKAANSDKIKAYNKKWRTRHPPSWYANNKDKRGVTIRKYQHAFTPEDETRFQEISTGSCDWCGLAMNGETPHVDHDRRCCSKKKHCGRCTRGFVHFRCNINQIAAYELIEQDCGFIGPKLAEYRAKFPVPRLDVS